MAKLEYELTGNFNAILDNIENTIFNGSFSASKEGRSDFVSGNARCAIRVYERYSMIGGNRVSLNLTLFQSDERIWLSAITSGGSQAVLFKMNTFGERAFLDSIHKTVAKYRK